MNQYPSEIKTPVNTLVVEPDNQESVVTETENVTSNATKIENLTNTKTSSKTSIDYLVVLKSIWVIGTVLVVSLIISKNWLFISRIFKKRTLYDVAQNGKVKIYSVEDINVPFLLGRSVYIPKTMNKLSDGYEKIICHEYCHFLIGDSVWQIVKYAFLCLLWFDPLVWIAYMLIQMDNELAVDELVIKRLGEDKRVEYGEALLSYANAGATNKLDLLSVNSFVGNNKDFIKKRIRNISKGTRKSVAALIIMSMVFTIMVSCSTVTPVVRASVIKEDDPWYETSSFTMGEQYNQGFEEDEYINIISSSNSLKILLKDDEFDLTPEAKQHYLGLWADKRYFIKITRQD